MSIHIILFDSRLPLAVKVVERDVHRPDRSRSGLPVLDGHDQRQT